MTEQGQEVSQNDRSKHLHTHAPCYPGDRTGARRSAQPRELKLAHTP